eukprot:SAG11_NODE_18515_length_488_cov_13.120823_1_plen_138_part_01
MPRVLKEKSVRFLEDFENVGTGGFMIDEPIVASTYTEPEGEFDANSQDLGSLDPSSSSSSSAPDDDMGRESGVVMNVVLPSDEQRDAQGLGYVSSQSTEGDENQDLHPDNPSALLEEVRNAEEPEGEEPEVVLRRSAR